MKIFKNNLKRLLGNKVRVAVLILVPLLFIMMFAINDFNTVTVAIVDQDNTSLTKNIIEQFKSKDYYNVKIIDKDNLNNQFLSYELDYAIVFDKGFTDKFFTSDELLIQDYYFYDSPNVLNAKTYIESYLQDLRIIKNSTSSDTMFYQTVHDFNQSKLSIHNLTDKDENLKSQTIVSFGFIVYFLVFMSAITCGIIIEDKKNGTLQRIFNSPISIRKYLFENLLSFIVVAFIQVFILVSTLRFVFHFYFAGGYFSLLLLLTIFSITSITMGLLIVSLVKTPIQMYLTVGILASPMAMLGGCYWPIDMMPKWLQNVGKLIPTSWVMRGVTDIINKESIGRMFESIGVLILFSIAFFIGGIIKKKEFAKV